MKWRLTNTYILTLIVCATLLSIAPQAASSPATNATPDAQLPLPLLDADCVRFLDPSAVVHGEIVYTNFSGYVAAVAHAVASWSPEIGFSVPLREAPPAGISIPSEATLVVRDANVPSTIFKGVTVTWTNAPATITLNQATLPLPDTLDEAQHTTLLAVVTHEFGHALGLGDVPPPGVTIRECANMLMKRSVDRGGGAFAVPQPGDVALYCLRWGGAICGEHHSMSTVPQASSTPESAALASPVSVAASGVPYFFAVVTCETRPVTAITSDDIHNDALPAGCAHAPAGVLFNIAVEGKAGYSMLTNGRGEFAVLLEGESARVSLPQSGEDLFPSLVGFRPVNASVSISTTDPACTTSPSPACHTVFVLFSDD